MGDEGTRQGKATIYDVATAAGVSLSTVSLALNQPGRVRAPTLQRILEAVDTLNYVPRAAAVARARQGVTRIGVVAPFTAYASFAQRLNGVLKAARQDHVEVIVYNEESAATARLSSLPITRPVDGLIVFALPLTEEIGDRLWDQGLATVLVESQHPRLSSVTIDDVAGGRIAGELLRDHGHREVAYIGHAQSVDYDSSSRQRGRGFAQAVGANVRELVCAHSIDAAAEVTRSLLAQHPGVTAIFGYDDVLAAGALLAARECGRSIPQDMEVIGFDDSELASGLGLTTVRQPLEESGRIAAELLLKSITANGQSVQQVQLSLTLTRRMTTRS